MNTIVPSCQSKLWLKLNTYIVTLIVDNVTAKGHLPSQMPLPMPFCVNAFSQKNRGPLPGPSEIVLFFHVLMLFLMLGCLLIFHTLHSPQSTVDGRQPERVNKIYTWFHFWYCLTHPRWWTISSTNSMVLSQTCCSWNMVGQPKLHKTRTFQTPQSSRIVQEIWWQLKLIPPRAAWKEDARYIMNLYEPDARRTSCFSSLVRRWMGEITLWTHVGAI